MLSRGYGQGFHQTTKKEKFVKTKPMEKTYCQSCGMPMGAADHGTMADGTLSPDYCHFCLFEGAFTADLTMEEMIQECLGYAESFRDENGNTYTRDEAIEQMRRIFPHLKRWKEAAQTTTAPEGKVAESV